MEDKVLMEKKMVERRERLRRMIKGFLEEILMELDGKRRRRKLRKELQLLPGQESGLNIPSLTCFRKIPLTENILRKSLQTRSNVSVKASSLG